MVILFLRGFICFVVSSLAAPPRLRARLRLLEVEEEDAEISLRRGDGTMAAFSCRRRRAAE